MPADNQVLEAIKRIKAYFEPHIRTDLREWLPLEKYLKIEVFPKRSIIKQTGEKEKRLRFILKGGGVKLIQKPFEDICFEICFEDEFFSDFESFNTGKSTNVYLKNFEPVTIASITRAQLISIYETSKLAVQLGRIMADQVTLKAHQHRLDHLGSIEERYKRMMKRQPEILLRVPLQHVASYLNISQQSLSRVRKMTRNWGK